MEHLTEVRHIVQRHLHMSHYLICLAMSFVDVSGSRLKNFALVVVVASAPTFNSAPLMIGNVVTINFAKCVAGVLIGPIYFCKSYV